MIWSWTARRLALMLRNMARHIPTEWLLRLDCTKWPPARRRDVLWMLAQTIIFQINQTRDSTLFGYIQHVRALENVSIYTSKAKRFSSELSLCRRRGLISKKTYIR
jgi:hypothetical protein